MAALAEAVAAAPARAGGGAAVDGCGAILHDGNDDAALDGAAVEVAAARGAAKKRAQPPWR